MGDRNEERPLTAAPQWAAAILALAILALVALTAIGARGLPGGETRPPPFPVDIDLLAVFRVMMGILAGLIALFVIVLFLPGGPPIKLPARKKSSAFKILAGIAVLFAILTILQPFAGEREEQPPPPAADVAVDDSESIGAQQSGSRWGLIFLAGAVLLVVFGIAVATRPEVESAEIAEPAAPELMTDVIDALLAELDMSNDPREVVIGAYARMERALTVADLPRRRSEAPLEYLARSLRRLDVSRPAVTRLTRLFEVARFSDHDIGPEMGVEAVTALGAVRDELMGVGP